MKTTALLTDNKGTSILDELKGGKSYYEVSALIIERYKSSLSEGSRFTFSDETFLEWAKRISNFFLSEDSNYNKKRRFLRKLKDDIKWGLEKNIFPKNKNHLDLSKLGLFQLLPENIKSHPDLYEEWFSIWLNVGWFKDRNFLNVCLLNSILVNNVNITKRLVKENKLDINQDTINSSNLSLCCSDNEFYIPSLHSMKLGFFAKSVDMVETLTELGFNWDVIVCKNIPLLVAIQNKGYYGYVRGEFNFVSIDSQDKMVDIISKHTNSHKIKDVSNIRELIVQAYTRKSIDVLLSSIDYKDLRWENGENMLHMIAKYAPRFFKKAVRHNSENTALMNTPDNNGRYPLEYLLCFSSKEMLDKNEFIEIENSVRKGLYHRPDWLEVKILIAENQATYSGVDSVPLTIWKQEDVGNFRKCLSSNRGKSLMKLVADSFKYERTNNQMTCNNVFINYDTVYYGMEISRYTNSSYEEFSFFDLAKTKDEVEVALMQSWREFYHAVSERSILDDAKEFRLERGSYKNEVKEKITVLTNRAIKMGIDVVRMKERALESYQSKSMANKFFDIAMSKNIDYWSKISIEFIERKRLLLSIKKESISRNSKGLFL